MKRNSYLVIALVALVLGVLTPAVRATAPTIVPDNSKQPNAFLVRFDKGAVEACTIYASRTETLEQDGKTIPYTPRHCWLNDSEETSYVDDWDLIVPDGGLWDVYAEVYYEVAGSSELETRKTNVLQVRY